MRGCLFGGRIYSILFYSIAGAVRLQERGLVAQPKRPSLLVIGLGLLVAVLVGLVVVLLLLPFLATPPAPPPPPSPPDRLHHWWQTWVNTDVEDGSDYWWSGAKPVRTLPLGESRGIQPPANLALT